VIKLTVDRLAMLIRAGSVIEIIVKQKSDSEIPEWYVDVYHVDDRLTLELMTKRGKLRVFKSIDSALSALRGDCGYGGEFKVWPAEFIENHEEKCRLYIDQLREQTRLNKFDSKGIHIFHDGWIDEQ